ncbi:HAD-IA family hydrolase [Bradyrhizobium sp. RDM12]
MQQSAERPKSNDDQSRRLRCLRHPLRHPVGRRDHRGCVSGLWRDHHAGLADQAARIHLVALADAAYRNFSAVTRDSLAYTLRVLGLACENEAFERVIDKYLHLDLYPDATAALTALKPRKLAILSNGSPDMLNALVRNSGLDRLLDATISVDAKQIFKPSPQAYELVGEVLGTAPGRCCSSPPIPGTSRARKRSASTSPGSNG